MMYSFENVISMNNVSSKPKKTKQNRISTIILKIAVVFGAV